MANQLGIVHPDLLNRLQPTFYPTTATVRRKTSTPDGMGGLTEAWADVVTLQCRLAPRESLANETISADRLANASVWVIAFAGAPDVRDADRIVIGVRTFEVAKALIHTIAAPLTVIVTEIV